LLIARCLLVAAVLVELACSSKTSLRCDHGPESGSLLGGDYQACLDSLGRYHGPARSTSVVDGATINLTARYDADTPAGEWTCKRGRETLVLNFNPAMFRKELWGIERAPPPVADGRHLGPQPHLCPNGDWSTLPETGLIQQPMGNLTDMGVVDVVSYEIANEPDRVE